MHYITDVQYDSGFSLVLQFEDGTWRLADLEQYLDGEIFEPLRDAACFAAVRVNADIDTIVWENGADMAPDFLYEISSPVSAPPLMKAAEESVPYRTRSDKK